LRQQFERIVESVEHVILSGIEQSLQEKLLKVLREPGQWV
jgi:hypothetical protein